MALFFTSINPQSNLDETTSNLLNIELKAWESTLMEPLWDEGDWMPVTYHIHESLMENKVPLYTTPQSRKKHFKKHQNKNN